MTEIVQNNNGMKFDLLEPGNGGTGYLAVTVYSILY